jgi:general secretion pathway protein M
MSWLRTHQRTGWICGLTLLLPVWLYLDVLFSLWGMQREASAEIDRLAPRVARLQGLIDYEQQLRDAAVAVDSQVVELVYPAADDQATVAAQLQTNVRDIFGKAGLSVTNSQVLPVRAQGNFDYIGVKLTVTGSLSALDDALAGIAAYLPLVLVESLDVYPARASRSKDSGPPPQAITASLQVLSLRATQ